MNKFALLVAVLPSLCCRAGLAEEGQFSLGTGFDYSTGHYGEPTTTDILYVPVFGKYVAEPWEFKVTIPYLQVTGPSNAVLVDGQPLANGASTSRTTHSGLGDVVAAADYALFESAASGVIFDVIGKIKLPTASKADGLGTGELDYSVQGDLVKVVGRYSVLGTLGYRWLGSSSDIALDNVWFVSAGVVTKITPDWTGGVLYDYREAATARSAPQSEFTLYASRRLTPQLKGQLYGVRGISDGSPAWGLGGTIVHSF